MQLIKKILLLWVLSSLTLMLYACDDFTAKYYIGYDVDQSEYDIDNVALKFYFGVSKKEQKLIGDNNLENIYIFFTNSELDIEQRENAYEKKILFDETNPNISFIKEIAKEEFLSKDYLFEEGPSRRELLFCNHSEMITLPTSLFIGESGVIFFYLQTIDKRDKLYHSIYISVYIEYELLEDKVNIKYRGEKFYV